MNYSFIHQLLDNGYSEDEIMSSLIKSAPSLAKKASRLLSGGWQAKDILNFFSKDKEAQKIARNGLKPVTPGEIAAMRLRDSYNNIPQSAGQQSKEELQNFTKTAAPIALGALAAPMAQSALSRAIPKNLESMIPSLLPQQQTPGSQPQGQQDILPQVIKNTNQSQQPPINENVASVTQPQQTAQPEGIINPKEYLEKLGIKDKVDDLLNRGNTPEQAAASLGMKSGEGKLRGKIDPELLANIEAYSKEVKPEEKVSTTVPTEKIANVPIAKNETVSSPHGVGEVKEIRNGKAIVEIDGKKHQVDEEELEASPVPEKELADLYDDLIKGIEGETGEDVSRMVQWAGYNPETNTLQFLPHTGKLYKYGNISPEDAALLTDILSTRKTSGENFIGAWKAGSKSPIGAALSKLIRKLQSERGGKGSEYEETHEPIYSAYEPAVQAAKKKKKKK